MSRIDVRVEDVIAVVTALALVVVAGARALAGSFELTATDYWDFSFILLPVSLLTFGAALKYAIGGGTSQLSRTAARIGSTFRDWLPFLFVLLLYEALQAEVFRGGFRHDFDRELLNIDLRMLGYTPAVTMESWISGPLTDLMTLFYFLHLILPPVLGLKLYLQEKMLFRQFLVSVLAATALGIAGYVTVPAVGPAAAFPEMFTVSLDGALYGSVGRMIDMVRAPRDVFPSLHVCLSAIVLWFSWKAGRGWFAAILPLVIGNWISTMYLRYHYFIDVIAGWIAAVLAVVVARQLLRVEMALKRERGQAVVRTGLRTP